MVRSLHLTFILWFFVYMITMCNSRDKCVGSAYSWIARLREMQRTKKLFDLQLPNLSKGLDMTEKEDTAEPDRIIPSSYGVIGMPHLNKLNKLHEDNTDVSAINERNVFNSIDDFVREFEKKWHVDLKNGVKKSRDLRNPNEQLHLHDHVHGHAQHDQDNVQLDGNTQMLSSDENSPQLRAPRSHPLLHNPNVMNNVPFSEVDPENDDIHKIGNSDAKASLASQSFSESANIHTVNPLRVPRHSGLHASKMKRANFGTNFNMRFRPLSARSDYGPINSDFTKGLLPSGMEVSEVETHKLLNTDDVTPFRSSRNSGNLVDPLTPVKNAEDIHLNSILELARGPRSKPSSPVESTKIENDQSLSVNKPLGSGKQHALTIYEDTPERLARSSEILKKMKDLIKSYDNLDLESDVASSRAARSSYGPIGVANVKASCPPKHLGNVKIHEKLSFADQDSMRGSRSSDVPTKVQESELFDVDPVKAINSIISYLNAANLDSAQPAKEAAIGNDNAKVSLSPEPKMVNEDKSLDETSASRPARSSKVKKEPLQSKPELKSEPTTKGEFSPIKTSEIKASLLSSVKMSSVGKQKMVKVNADASPISAETSHKKEIKEAPRIDADQLKESGKEINHGPLREPRNGPLTKNMKVSIPAQIELDLLHPKRNSDKSIKASDADPVKDIHDILNFLTDLDADSSYSDNGLVGTKNAKVSSSLEGTEMANKHNSLSLDESDPMRAPRCFSHKMKYAAENDDPLRGTRSAPPSWLDLYPYKNLNLVQDSALEPKSNTKPVSNHGSLNPNIMKTSSMLSGAETAKNTHGTVSFGVDDKLVSRLKGTDAESNNECSDTKITEIDAPQPLEKRSRQNAKDITTPNTNKRSVDSSSCIVQQTAMDHINPSSMNKIKFMNSYGEDADVQEACDVKSKFSYNDMVKNAAVHPFSRFINNHYVDNFGKNTQSISPNRDLVMRKPRGGLTPNKHGRKRDAFKHFTKHLLHNANAELHNRAALERNARGAHGNHGSRNYCGEFSSELTSGNLRHRRQQAHKEQDKANVKFVNEDPTKGFVKYTNRDIIESLRHPRGYADAKRFLESNIRDPRRYVIRVDDEDGEDGMIKSESDLDLQSLAKDRAYSDKLLNFDDMEVSRPSPDRGSCKMVASSELGNREYKNYDDDNSEPNADYIKQLEDSFPRDQGDFDDKDNTMKELQEHVRVKRYT